MGFRKDSKREGKAPGAAAGLTEGNGRMNRRQMLRALSYCAAGGVMAPMLTSCRQELLTPEDHEKLGPVVSKQQRLEKKPKFLIVVAAAGGASIIDSFMARRVSELGANASTLNAFPDNQVTNVAGTPFRAVQYQASSLGAIPIGVNTNQNPFVNKHKAHMLVAANIGTSVNHAIAQKRSLTGGGIWKGRTMQEAVALEYGAGFPIPNVNMGNGGYLERGTDDTLPAYCYGETVANPSLWPLGLDGMKGIKGAPDRELVELARKARNEKLDAESNFAKTFAKSERLKIWAEQRGAPQARLEALDLINKLNILPNQPPQLPFAEYGLGSSPDAAKLRQTFPGYSTDAFEGQAALAYLLIKNRVSVSVTIAPSFNVILGGASGLANPPLAFDYSHNDHRGGQAFMWARILGVVDKLVDLLKAEPYEAGSSESLFDHTMIYVATDFGRTRQRAANSTAFGTGHDMNNGVLMVSPLVKGNTVLGEVNPATMHTVNFDPVSGATNQDPNPRGASNEQNTFAGVLQALGVDTSGSGLPDAKAYRKV